MAKLKIAIVISTTRAARFGHKPAQWVRDIAAERGDIETEIIDLRDFPMPFFDEVASNAWAPSQNPVAKRWQKKIAEFDGFIFVTAEYNHGIPAALKRYGRLRRSRVRRVEHAARRNGRIYHFTGPMALARDLAIKALGAQRMLARQDWIYDWRA